MTRRENQIINDFSEHVKLNNQPKNIKEGDYCYDKNCKGRFILQKDIFYKGVYFYECNICGWYINEQINKR